MRLPGRYTVVKKLADGGMAEIFLATQTGAEGFAREVILKRILPVFSGDPHFRNMLVDEAHIAMTLQHGNIVQVLDLGEAEGRYFLVMELVDGWDLSTVLARAETALHALPMGLCLYVVAEVCRGLAYAHGKAREGKSLEIVHRDISPQNILVSEQGEVKLTDFGIAKALGKRDRTQAGVIKGKLEFMSPEQAAGETLDARSDIFAVGTVLYLLVTGRRPFAGGTDLETLLRIQKAQFEPPEKVRSNLSPQVAAIIARAMQRVPGDRYQSAEEMMRDVEGALRTEFGSAGQSELKRYLDDLGRRDGALPISRNPALPEEEPTARGKRTLALNDATRGDLGMAETRLQGAPEPPATAIPPPPRSTEKVVRPRGSPLARAVLVLLTLGAAGVVIVRLGPRVSHQLLSEAQRRLSSSPQVAPAKGLPAAPEHHPSPSPVIVTPLPAEEPREAPPAREALPDRREASAERASSETRGKKVVTLRLSSRPTGATVKSHEGGTLGQTPLALSLRPGTVQRLTFTKHGYASVTRKVTVGGGSQSVVVELSRSAARRGRGRH
jgi:serine/threonine protein kinase